MTLWGDPATWGDLLTWESEDTPVPVPPGTDAPGTAPPSFLLAGIGWTIDGTDIHLLEASGTASWDGGYDQARGKLRRTELEAVPSAAQGSILRATTPDGRCRWEGRLTSPPRLEPDWAYLSAQGHRVKAEKKTDRLFIQSADESLLATTDSEPHLDSAGEAVYGASEKIGVAISGTVRFKLDRDEAIATDRENGVVFYAEGVELERVAWYGHWDAADNEPDLSIRVYRANGPVGAETFVNGFACDSGERNTTQDVTLGTAQDLILLMAHTTAAITPTQSGTYSARKLRFNSNINTTDSMSSSEIVDYIAGEMGWDTIGVDDTSDNALPFDWDEASWADALTYLATNEDRYWRVLDDRASGPVLEFNDWGTNTWELYLSNGTSADLTPGELFNRVWVWYETPRGIRRRVSATADDLGLVDPLANSGITNTFEHELADRDPDSDHPQRIANTLLRRVIRPTFSGRVECSVAFNEMGENDPYGILPGDVVRIADWGPNEAISLRVMDTDLLEHGTALGVEQPMNLDAVLRRRRPSRRG